MLLILSKEYAARLMVPDSGVAREVEHAVSLVKKGAGHRLLFASPDPGHALKFIVPMLPRELRELVEDRNITDITHKEAVEGLALGMSGLCSHPLGAVERTASSSASALQLSASS